jgi:hypothetical protein
LQTHNRPEAARHRHSRHADESVRAATQQSPRANQYRIVFREQPSSAEIRFDPHPNPFNRSNADTSSGAFITSLRWSPRPEGTAASFVKTLSVPRRGLFLMSSGGQFVVSPDTA